MSLVLLRIILSGVAVVGSYCFAYWISRQESWEERKRQTAGDAVGIVFSLALLVFLDTLSLRISGISFFQLLKEGSRVPIVTLVAGGVLGMAYEYIGQLALKRWYYPAVEREKFLFFVLPVFWGIFMLVVQDTWAIFIALGLGPALSVLLIAFVHFVLIEGINIFTNSWVYTGWAKSPLVLFLGWIVLVLTSIVLFNHFIFSPLGF